MVNHNQQRVKPIGQQEVGDKINRELLERASARGGERGQCGDGWMGVNLHLLAKSTAKNKTVNKGRHTQPPIVTRQQRIGAEEASMSGSEGQMHRGHKVMMGDSGNIEVVFEIKVGSVIVQICN